jgi:hypothetical protein
VGQSRKKAKSKQLEVVYWRSLGEVRESNDFNVLPGRAVTDFGQRLDPGPVVRVVIVPFHGTRIRTNVEQICKGWFF